MGAEHTPEEFDPHSFVGFWLLNHLELILPAAIAIIGGWIGLRMRNRRAFDRLNDAVTTKVLRWLAIWAIVLIFFIRLALGALLSELESTIYNQSDLKLERVISTQRFLSLAATYIEVYILILSAVIIATWIYWSVSHVLADEDEDADTSAAKDAKP